MAKDRNIRVCGKKSLFEAFYSGHGIEDDIFTWHTTVQAAQKYYAKHHETQKKELVWAEHGAPYLPLYPRKKKS